MATGAESPGCCLGPLDLLSSRSRLRLVKRRDLMKRLNAIAKAEGLTLRTTEGGRHTKVQIDDRQSVVPRHAEINEITAKAILRQMSPKTEEEQ